jgi:hypothetical protein
MINGLPVLLLISVYCYITKKALKYKASNATFMTSPFPLMITDPTYDLFLDAGFASHHYQPILGTD